MTHREADEAKQYPRDRARAIYVASRWRARNPQKCRAIASVGYAVRSSNIQRGPCERCNTEKFVCAFHHQGYDKPLVVVWRCRRCNNRTKRDLKKANEALSA
jgi:hypothetical protein